MWMMLPWSCPVAFVVGFPVVTEFLRSGLPSECELELQQQFGKSVNMLECSISVVGDKVVILHRNKNEASLLANSCQHYRKFVDFTSSHPVNMEMGVLMGTLSRVLRNTAEGAVLHCMQQFLLYLAEWSLLQYPFSCLRRAVARFFPGRLSPVRQATWEVCAPILTSCLHE